MSGSRYACGIDFGTSNSTCAVFDGGEVHLVPLEADKKILPSSLFFGTDGQAYFGQKAIDLYVEGEDGRLMRGLKSVLGTSLMAEKTQAGGKSRTFEEILSLYLSHLKKQADDFAGINLETVVMGRPVHFHDDNPDADTKSEDVLRNIARGLGFKNISFQYEPISAAYAHEQGVDGEKLAIVVDLGGGTSDFTVIRLSPERAKKGDRSDDILATSGIRVGGTNFDKSLSLASFMDHFGMGTHYYSEFDKDKLLRVPAKTYQYLSDWPFIHQAQSAKAVMETEKILRSSIDAEKIKRLLHLQQGHLGHLLLQMVERAKINLTDMPECYTDLSALELDLSVYTSREDFLCSILGLVQDIENNMNECLLQSGCKSEDIDLVILTGGSSELPVINAMVHKKFPQAKVSKDDKFGSVGRGLAYGAAQMQKCASLP